MIAIIAVLGGLSATGRPSTPPFPRPTIDRKIIILLRKLLEHPRMRGTKRRSILCPRY